MIVRFLCFESFCESKKYSYIFIFLCGFACVCRQESQWGGGLQLKTWINPGVRCYPYTFIFDFLMVMTEDHILLPVIWFIELRNNMAIIPVSHFTIFKLRYTDQTCLRSQVGVPSSMKIKRCHWSGVAFFVLYQTDSIWSEEVIFIGVFHGCAENSVLCTRGLPSPNRNPNPNPNPNPDPDPDPNPRPNFNHNPNPNPKMRLKSLSRNVSTCKFTVVQFNLVGQ